MHEPPTDDAFAELEYNRRREQARYAARAPKRMGDVVGRLMARRGYGRVCSSAELNEAWRQAAGQALAAHTRPGQVRRGVLEIMVAHSALVQELTYAKATILAALQRLVPDQGIRDLRFRSGSIA